MPLKDIIDLLDGWDWRFVGPCNFGTNTLTKQSTWVFVILGNTYDIKTGQWRTASNSLLNAQELWFAVFMTILYASFSSFSPSLMFFSILLPWVTLREVPVEVEIVSHPLSILRIELISVAVAQSGYPTI